MTRELRRAIHRAFSPARRRVRILKKQSYLTWDTQLQPGQIRLFNIQLDDSDDIRGTLKIFMHKSSPKYLAQSYVCGVGKCIHRIAVNGSAHYIKHNLSVALRQTKNALRKRKSGEEAGSWTQTTWLWIDAICIDQNNVMELEMQVRFMDHTYKGASSTFVSLGVWSRSHELICLFFTWFDADAEIFRLKGARDCRCRVCRSADEERAQALNVARSRRTCYERRLEVEFSMSGEAARVISDALGKGEAKQSDFSRVSAKRRAELPKDHVFAIVGLMDADIQKNSST